jgi:hypothetical protein
VTPTLSPAQAAWLDSHVGQPAGPLRPEDAAILGAQRGYLLAPGRATVLVAQDLDGRWILGGRTECPQAPWCRDRIFRPVPQTLWPAADHAVLLAPDTEQAAHQLLAATALADALGLVPTPPWPSLLAVGSPGALLLFGIPVAEATGFLQGMPPERSPLPPLLAVLPPP